MAKTREQFIASGRPNQSGFTLAEFLISMTIILGLSSGVFTMLADVQSNSGYQTEVLTVMENARTAMKALERYILQAGNNPTAASFVPVSIVGASEMQIRSDLTGSGGGSQGDPDGDILDANEDITIRYHQNSSADRNNGNGVGSIELVTADGTVRTLANHISGLTLAYLDKDGNATTAEADIRTIRITIIGSSTVPNPRTGKTFGFTITGVAALPNLG